MTQSDQALLLHPSDDVIVAKSDLAQGAVVRAGPVEVVARSAVNAGHKLARKALAEGAPIRRYGQIIGHATADIAAGEHVHLHNLAMGGDAPSSQVGQDVRPVDFYSPAKMRFFDGYRRSDGRVGTRNYIALISTVNCSASVTQFVRDRFKDVHHQYPHVDGVIALTHHSGCGQVLNGADHQGLQRVLAGYAQHPNVGAFVIIGLGCEVNQAAALVEQYDLRLRELGGERPPIIGIQQEGGVKKAVEAGVAAVEKLLPWVNAFKRTPQPLSALTLATNCGGSDGNSGITANPALGWAVDELVRYGGTAVLAETTEIYGAEHLLVRRAVSQTVADKLLGHLAWWQKHLEAGGGTMKNNPAPGNHAGGLTTIAEKSLGGIAKGGTTPLVDVIGYAEPITTPGFVFMNTPGHDPVSVTGLVAGGANVVCFTTGRGSVLGCKPTPSLKLASNSALYRRMQDDMDLDCGVVLEDVSLETMGSRVFEELIAVASGKPTKSELNGLGEAEFAPWLMGPVL